MLLIIFSSILLTIMSTIVPTIRIINEFEPMRLFVLRDSDLSCQVLIRPAAAGLLQFLDYFLLKLLKRRRPNFLRFYVIKPVKSVDSVLTM